jgi:hypothetical protein
MEFTVLKTRVIKQLRLLSGLLPKRKRIEKNTDIAKTKTQYQEWKLQSKTTWKTRQKRSQKRLTLYPYLAERVQGGGIELSAVMWLMFLFAVIYFWWGWVSKDPPRVLAQQIAQQTLDAYTLQNSNVVSGSFLIEVPDEAVGTPEPTQEQVTPTATVTPTFSPTLDMGYTKVMIVARFSNYWPPFGGTNCFADCAHFADGERVDQAIAESWKVVACPEELLLGTRIEYPPNSGVIWVCRDRGSDIYFYYSESELPIYWFDFMSEVPWVDFGSYIQVQVYVPNSQVEMMP